MCLGCRPATMSSISMISQVSKESYYRGKRDQEQVQKKPTIGVKETKYEPGASPGDFVEHFHDKS